MYASILNCSMTDALEIVSGSELVESGSDETTTKSLMVRMLLFVSYPSQCYADTHFYFSELDRRVTHVETIHSSNYSTTVVESCACTRYAGTINIGKRLFGRHCS